MIRKFYEVDEPSGGWISPKPITGEDVAALLHGIHTHAEFIVHDVLSVEQDTQKSGDDVEAIQSRVYYAEEDLLPVLKALGLPAPVWKKSMTVEEWKKSRK